MGAKARLQCPSAVQFQPKHGGAIHAGSRGMGSSSRAIVVVVSAERSATGCAADGRRVSVAFVHDTTEFGGVEIVLLRLLVRLNRDRFAPFVVVADGVVESRRSPEQFLSQVDELGVPIVRYFAGTGARAGKLREVFDLRRVLVAARADVVHIHTCRVEGARKIALAAKLARVPVVLRTEHSSPSAFSRMPANTLTRRMSDRLVDLTLTVSENDRQEQISLVGRSPQAVRTLHNGVDVSEYDPSAVVAADYGAASRNRLPVIGAVGRLTELKGHADLIEAAALLARDGCAFKLLLVGAGPLEGELRDLASSLGVEQSVDFVGHQVDPKPWIKAMDVAVMPSLHEGFSLSLLEFMSMARPTVVTDHPGLVEAITVATSVVVPRSSPSELARAIGELVGDPDRAKAMGAAGRQHVTHEYSLDDYVRDTEGLFEQLLAAHRAR